jgi:hypothetical protein
LSLPVGVLVDRTRRRPLLIVADMLSVLGTLYIPFVSGAPEQVVLLLGGVSLTTGFALPMVFVVVGDPRLTEGTIYECPTSTISSGCTEPARTTSGPKSERLLRPPSRRRAGLGLPVLKVLQQ